MRLLSENLADASTLSLNSGSGTKVNMVDRKDNTKWISVGKNADDAGTGTCIILCLLASATTAPFNIMLKNHNWKSFDVEFRGPSAVISYSSITGNAFSNTMMTFGTVTGCYNIEFYIRETFVPNAEKFCHEMYISKGLLAEFSPPSNEGFQQSINSIGQQIVMNDGGIINSRVSTKYSANLALQNATNAQYNSLYSAWNTNKDMLFIPFPQNNNLSYWDGQCESVCWVGDFNLNPADNNLSNGYSGTISLAQVPD